MIDYEADLEKIKALTFGQHATVHWSEGGGGLVICISTYPKRVYELYDVPQYGGEPRFYNAYVGNEERMLDVAYTWT